MSEKYSSFTELEVWKKARVFKNDIKGLVTHFPSEEKFRLVDQIVRSTRSISANIAEGHGRFSYKDQIHFCVQARGSLSETHNHLIDSLDCTYITEEIYQSYKEKIMEIERLLNGYISWLRSKVSS